MLSPRLYRVERDTRFWPTLLGMNKPTIMSKLPVPDDNFVRETLADKYNVPSESISPGLVTEYINKTVHQPNNLLSSWQEAEQKLLSLFSATLGPHLHFHVSLAKTGSEAYRIIENMFSERAQQHVWAEWSSFAFGCHDGAMSFVRC